MGANNQEIPPRYSANWIESLDMRTSLSRAVRGRLAELEADLGGNLSYQRQSLCKRVVWMEAVIEQKEAALARGEDVGQAELTQAVNSLIGLLKTLGLDRKARDAPSLGEYLHSRRGE